MENAWVLSLSIDEEVRWAMCQVDRKTGAYVLPEYEKPTAGKRLLDLSAFPKLDLNSSLLRLLKTVRDRNPDEFRKISAVGISSVGIIDRDSKSLINFDRRDWVAQNDDYDHGEYKDDQTNCLVDFQEIFKEIIEQDVLIEVQNDATAKAMAEYEFSFAKSDDKPELLCYANFHAGVNAGYVSRLHAALPWSSHPLNKTFLHQEVGHTCAPALPAGQVFDQKFSGCPVHKTCFVGVASNTRIYNQWGKPLSHISYDEDDLWNPREEISFYIAHFIHNIILNVTPTKVLLAGDVIFPELIEMSRDKFKKLNDFNGRRYFDYPELRDVRKFISPAGLTVNQAGVMGGFELARRMFHNSLMVSHG